MKSLTFLSVAGTRFPRGDHASSGFALQGLNIVATSPLESSAFHSNPLVFNNLDLDSALLTC
jgi:hypothetical protein